MITGTTSIDHMAWEAGLKPGALVIAAWTNSYRSNAEKAAVVRVNSSTISIRILSGEMKGRRFTVPRFGVSKWSKRNGAFAFDPVEWAKVEAQRARLDEAIKRAKAEIEKEGAGT